MLAERYSRQPTPSDSNTGPGYQCRPPLAKVPQDSLWLRIHIFFDTLVRHSAHFLTTASIAAVPIYSGTEVKEAFLSAMVVVVLLNLLCLIIAATFYIVHLVAQYVDV